jgi:Zn-dependent metalloprotease
MVFASSAYAKRPTELNAREFEKSVAIQGQGIAISDVSAAPRLIANPGYAVSPGTPEQMARQYLSENSALLKMQADLSDLAFDGVVETPAGVHVHFHQVVAGATVEGSDLNVSIDRSNRVSFLTTGYRPNATPESPHSLFTSKAALGAADRYLSLNDPAAERKSDRVVFIGKDGKARFATRVRVHSRAQKLWAWEVLVDQATGEVLRAKDRALYGKALVFDPNPVIKSGNIYGTGGIVDNNNADSDVLTSLLTEVDLDDITTEGTNYILTGKYASSQEIEAPTNPDCAQASADFKLTRGAPCFDMVNAYYFISKQLRYINEQLGYAVMPIQYQGGVHFDAHGVDGDDNSHYDPASGILAFGEGGVDDAQDHDVILHELGHGIHDWITKGNLSQEDGLSEGVGDYFASSYSRQFMKPDHPAFNWTFSFDGHNEFWPGRVLNNPSHYPEGLQGEVHADGEIWASTMGDVYIAIGKDAADRDMLEALSMLNATANQNAAAQAVLTADLKLFPKSDHQDAIKKIFTARGYTL